MKVEENKITLGKYGKIFEDEYKKILDNFLNKNDMDSEYEKYLKRTENDVSKVHNGYFSEDKTTKKIKIKRIIKFITRYQKCAKLFKMLYFTPYKIDKIDCLELKQKKKKW